jgi:hypothetical protein
LKPWRITMLRLTALALLIPATAVADEMAPTEPIAAPGACTTCVAAPVAAPRPSDMQRRWGVSARAVSLSLYSQRSGSSEINTSEYEGGGVAASYRISRRWEVSVALDALDTTTGPDLHSTTISARFHLTPHRRWDWYLIAGVGVLHEAPLEGQEHAAKDPGRGRFHMGAGLARRWHKWSLAAELHSVAVAPKDPAAAPMSTSHATTPTPPAMATEERLGGAELTIAATFFF